MARLREVLEHRESPVQAPAGRSGDGIVGLSAPRTDLWRVVADLRHLDDRPLDLVRLLLSADVLRRVVEDLCGGQVLLGLLTTHGEATPPWFETADALQIRRPWTSSASLAEVTALLGGRPRVVLTPEGLAASAEVPGPTGERTLRVSGVTLPRKGAGHASVRDLVAEGDPLALRLALLRFGRQDPAVLSTARMHRAEETLHRWRLKVAGWADMPAAPAHPEQTAAMRRALVADLDAATVLRLLHRLECDPHWPSGSKFETFAQLDHVLALDLCHVVGKLPR